MQDYVLTDLVDAIADGREPQTSLEKALVLQRITDGVHESAQSGVAVEIR